MAIFRPPIYSRLAKATAVTTFVAANLLPTLLAPTAAPFSQDSWTIQPKLAQHRPAEPQRNLLLSLPPGSLPLNQSNWPKPQPTPRVSVNFESRNLLAPLLAPPFAQEDWPKLARVLGRQANDPLNLLTTTLAPAIAPFALDIWPIQPQVALLKPAEATLNLLLTLPPGSLPLNPDDWPKAPLAPRRLALTDSPNLLNTTLAPIAGAPFVQTNWPKLQRPPDLSGELSHLNLALGVEVEVPSPFSQSDWPIRPPLVLLRPADAIPDLLLRLPPGALAFSQDDWPKLQPTPRVRAPDVAPNLLETLRAPTTAPFVQSNWALVPKFVTLRPAEPIPDTLLSLPPGKLAFSQTSWPIQPRMAVHRLPDAPRNITINLPAPQVAAGGIKHKRKWRRT